MLGIKTPCWSIQGVFSKQSCTNKKKWNSRYPCLWLCALIFKEVLLKYEELCHQMSSAWKSLSSGLETRICFLKQGHAHLLQVDNLSQGLRHDTCWSFDVVIYFGRSGSIKVGTVMNCFVITRLHAKAENTKTFKNQFLTTQKQLTNEVTLCSPRFEPMTF